MISKIPEKFSKVRHIIEKLYKGDDTFRSIYEDYQTYLDALQFDSNWIHLDNTLCYSYLLPVDLDSELESEKKAK